MKKVVIVVVLGSLAVLALPLSNLFSAPPAVKLSAQLPPALADALAAKCVDCHSSKGRAPLYASLPIAGPKIAADIMRARSFWDLDRALGPEQKEIPEVELARLEHVLRKGNMPPHEYRMMHWGSGLGAGEKAAFADFIAEQRRQRFATADASEGIKGDALQPLPLKVDYDAKKAELGDALYHDTRLSGDGTLSCASCHALDKGGTDLAAVSTGIKGQKGPISAPTVYNSRYMLRQFWDGRAADLQEQAAGPVDNPIEMGDRWPDVIAELSQDAELVERFTQVYPQGLSKETVTHAIAEFEKSLVTPNSPFDRYLRGQRDAMDATALLGYRHFVELGCATCHVGKAMGGQSFEKLGRAADYFADRGDVKEVDRGRANFTKDEADLHRFKVPTLRNIAQTAPYFHDGSQATLAEAVKAMAHYQLGIELDAPQTEALVAFLRAQTGQFRGTPVQ